MKLSTKQRKNLPDSDFVFPETHSYPIPDRAHAANAKARASQEYNHGRISASTRSRIDAKANRMLNRGRRGS